MQCPTCRNDSPEDARFCVTCGASVSASTASGAPVEPAGEAPLITTRQDALKKLAQGIQALDAGEAEDAIECFTAVMAARPLLPLPTLKSAYFKRIDALRKLDRHEEADADEERWESLADALQLQITEERRAKPQKQAKVKRRSVGRTVSPNWRSSNKATLDELEKVGLVQRGIMGLAFLLLPLIVGIYEVPSGLYLLFAPVWVALGVTTVRPPGGIRERVLEVFGCLVILFVVVVISLIAFLCVYWVPDNCSNVDWRG